MCTVYIVLVGKIKYICVYLCVLSVKNYFLKYLITHLYVLCVVSVTLKKKKAVYAGRRRRRVLSVFCVGYECKLVRFQET